MHVILTKFHAANLPLQILCCDKSSLLVPTIGCLGSLFIHLGSTNISSFTQLTDVQLQSLQTRDRPPNKPHPKPPWFTISITKASAVSVEHTTNGITPHCTIHNSKALPCCGLTVPCISHNLYLQLVVTEDTLQMWSALNSAKRELY